MSNGCRGLGVITASLIGGFTIWYTAGYLAGYRKGEIDGIHALINMVTKDINECKKKTES